ncbi:MAG: HD domain-containing protein [Gammaproteobacteria bacterium]|jgi:(p)ppGpp synthase/HD superfamily hydrolase|nr:HD domain-containing protein [Gammaproteobacteria bacterium]
MPLIETALQIALSAHRGQQDKAGRPYILHPLRVMAAMQTDAERAVALLHDVIEDGDWDRAGLIEAGIPAAVADAVETLSRRDGEEYPAFIERVCANPLAARVKRADVEDNLQVLRLPALSKADLARVAKYHRAWQQLTAALELHPQ